MIKWHILRKKIIGICYNNCYENIEPDLDKILGLAFAWLRKEKNITEEEIDEFCCSIDNILKQEIEIRLKSTNENAVWLTK